MNRPYICSTCLHSLRQKTTGGVVNVNGRIRQRVAGSCKTQHPLQRQQRQQSSLAARLNPQAYATTVHPSSGGNGRLPRRDPVLPGKLVAVLPGEKTYGVQPRINDRNEGTNQADFDRIGESLDDPLCDAAKVHDKLMSYLHGGLFFKQMMFKLHVIRSPIPRKLLQKVIEVQYTVEDVPSPENLLEYYATLEIDNEYHWADVMFDYLKKEQEADVISLWARFQRRLEKHSQMLVSNAQFATLNSSLHKGKKSGPAATSYPIVAALTAHLAYQHKNLIEPSLMELLRVLDQKFALEGAQIPPPDDVAKILRLYKMPDETIKRTIAALGEIRPYASKENSPETKVLSAIDEIYLAAATRDKEKLHTLYKAAISTPPTEPVEVIPPVAPVEPLAIESIVPEQSLDSNGAKAPAQKKKKKKQAPPPPKSKPTTYVLPPFLYQAFIYAFMRCRDSISAYSVWNHMVEHGTEKPELKMWGALLDGCAKIGNVGLFEITWAKLQASGMQPDLKCWTMRMQAYFKAGDADSAKKILLQMEKKLNITTYTINAAITGLDNLKLYADSFTLLQWATKKFDGRIGDSITFNIIIRSQVKQGRFSEAQKTLALMREVGVKPDIITYSEIMNGMYMYSEQAPSIDFINIITQEMRSQGINPNLQFYNTIIYGLLTKFKDLEGARQVLNLMPDPRWRYSAITSNMFIQYHLTRLEFTAVEAIWLQMKAQRVVADPAVYNVTIKGYAMAGHRERMMFWFGEMLRVKKQPNIATYIWILRCLSEHGDLVTAAEVTAECLKKGEEYRGFQDLRVLINDLRKQGMLVKVKNDVMHRRGRIMMDIGHV